MNGVNLMPGGAGSAGTEAVALSISASTRPFAKATLLRAGDACRRDTDWHARRPAIGGHEA